MPPAAPGSWDCRSRRRRRFHRRATPTRCRGSATVAQRRELRRPVVAVAREEAHVVALDARDDAIAVELDLVDPARAGRRLATSVASWARTTAAAAWPRSGALRLPRSPLRRRAAGLLARRVLKSSAARARLRPRSRWASSGGLEHAIGGSATLYSAAGRAKSSRSLISSHGSWRSPARPCMRTSVQPPCSFSPCSSNLSLPAR